MQTIKAASAISMMRSRLYGKGRARTPLFKAITGVLAAEMTLMGLTPVVMAANLPQSSAGYGAGMNVSGQKLTIDGAQGAGSSFTWDQGFNIGQGYTVQFQNIAAAVNKDTSGQLSSILGNLFSDGAVYILNPNGILFGSSAVVDVHGLIAAAVGSVGKGLDGEFVFSKLGSGNVVNQGSISAGDFAYLVGRSVENSGSISAANVALAAFGGTGADSITIASTESGAKITFQIPEGTIAEAGEDDGGEVAVSGAITGIQNEQAQNEGGARRAMASTPNPEDYKDGDDNININGRLVDNIAIYGADINIESDAIGKNVSISGTKGVTLGGGSAEKVFVKANDGNVDIVAGNYINVKGNADVSAVKGDTAEAADVTMTAGGNINMGGTITANDGTVTLKAGDETLNAVNADKKSVKIGYDGVGTVEGALITAAGNVELDGGKSSQLIAGEIKSTGGTVSMTGKEYVAVNGDITGKEVSLKATEAKETSTTSGSYSGDAGVIQLSGTITAADKLDISSAGMIEAQGTIKSEKQTDLSAEGGQINLTGTGNVIGGTVNVTGTDVNIVNGEGQSFTYETVKSNDKNLTLQGNAQDVTIANNISITGDFAVENAGNITLNAGVGAANITFSGTQTTVAGDITGTGDLNVKNAAGTATADLTQGSGNISAANIIAANITQNGGTMSANGGSITARINDSTLGTITQSGDASTTMAAATITASQINQSGGKITATTKITANVTQSGCEVDTPVLEGNLMQTHEDDLATVGRITGDVGQSVTGAKIQSKTAYDSGNLTIVGNLTQTAGTIENVKVLTLQSGGTMGGTVTADSIVAKKDAATKELTASGTVTANSIEASTLAASGEVNADTINAEVTQTAGTINRKGTDTTLAFQQTLTQQGGTIGDATTPYKVTVDGAFAQNGDNAKLYASTLLLKGGATQTKGIVEAATLDMQSASADVTLAQTGNKFDTIGGNAKDVDINDSADNLVIDNIVAANLTLSAVGAVTQSAAAEVAGATAVAVADGSAVTLDNAGNKLGSVGVVGKTGAAGAAKVVDSDSTLVLDGVKAASLDVTAAGAVTQSAGKKVEVEGLADITSKDGDTAKDITLGNDGNELGSLKATGAAVTVKEDSADGLKLDDIGAASLTVTAKGDLTQVADKKITATGLADITSTGGDIKLTAANNELTTFKGAASTAGKAVKVVNAKALEVQGITAGTTASRGDILVKATGDNGAINATTVPISGNNVTLSASKDITEGVAVTAAADKLVESTGGAINVDAAGTITGKGAYLANGALTVKNGQTLKADGDSLYVKAASVSGNLAGDELVVETGAGNSVKATGGTITYGTGKTTVSGASKVAASTTDDLVVNSGTTALEVGAFAAAGDDVTIQEVKEAVTAAKTLVVAGDGGVDGISAKSVDIDAGKVTVNKSVTATVGNIDIGSAGTEAGIDVNAALTASGNAITLDAGSGKTTVNANVTAGTLNLKSATTEVQSGTTSVTTLDAAGKTLQISGTGDVDVMETLTAATLDVDAGTVDAKNVTAKVDQDGGAITVAETIIGAVEQKGATEAVTLSAKKIDGTLTQEAGNNGVVTVGNVTGATVQNGGKIQKRADADRLKFDSTVTQYGGTIANDADSVYIFDKFTQSGGTLNASQLEFRRAAEQTAAAGTVNAVAIILPGGAFDVTLNEGNNKIEKVSGTVNNLAIKDTDGGLVIGDDAQNGDNKKVKALGTVTLEATAGDITQEANLVASGLTTLTAKNVNLANSEWNSFNGGVTATATADNGDVRIVHRNIGLTENLDVQGVEAGNDGKRGDVLVKVINGGIAVNGSVNGRNVTLKADKDITEAAKVNALGISADGHGDKLVETTGGDIYVNVAGTINGKGAYFATSTDASNGKVIVTDGQTLKANGDFLYIEANELIGKIEGNEKITSIGSGENAKQIRTTGGTVTYDSGKAIVTGATKIAADIADDLLVDSRNVELEVGAFAAEAADVKIKEVGVAATTDRTLVASGEGALDGINAKSVEVDAQSVAVNADVTAKGDNGNVSIDALNGSLTIASGKTVKAEKGDVALTAKIDTTAATPATEANVTINGATVLATAGSTAAGAVELAADSAVAIDNSIVTADKKVIVGAANDKSGSLTIWNGAAVTGKEGVEAYVSGNAIIDNAMVKAGKFTWDPASTEAPAIANDDIANMVIDAGGDILVQGNAAVGASGTLGLAAAGDNGTEINASKVASKGNMTIEATKQAVGSVSVQNGYVGTKGKLDINAAKDVTIDPSTVESEDDIDIDATAGDVVIEASKVASSKTITIGKDANVGGDITIRADASDTRSLVMAKTGLAANANGNITIDKSTVVSGIVDDGTDTVDPYVSDATADMALNAAKAVAVQGGARVGAANALDIDSGAEGVSIDGTGTKAVAKNGDMTIDANNGAVTVSGGAYVGGNEAIDIGKTTGKTTSSLTVKDASQLVAAGNVSAKVSDAIAVQNTAKVGSDAQVTLEATGDDATITVADSALVIAKDKVDLTAANGTVALTDTAKVRVTGGAAAQDPALVLNGGKGVTASASTTIDATGANLDVDAKTGAIALNGKILAKDADFTAKEGTTGQAITADNANNNFTGTVTADGASVKIVDANDINLGNVTANGDAATGSVLVETVKGSITVLDSATVESKNVNVTLTASMDTSATEGGIVVNGKVIADNTATLTAEKGSITDKTDETINHGNAETAPWATGTYNTHVKAQDAVLLAQAIGAAGKPLDTEVETIDATATAGSVYVWEKDGIEVKNLSATKGNAELENLEGNITLSGTACATKDGNAYGNVLLGAKTGNLVLGKVDGENIIGGTVSAGNAASLLAGGNIDQNASVTAASVDAQAFGNASTITLRKNVQTEADLVRYVAKGGVTLNENAVLGKEGATVVVNGSLTGDGNVTAETFGFDGANLGAANAPMKLSVSTLAAKTTGDVFVENDKALTIGTAAAGNAGITRVHLDGETSPVGGVSAGNEIKGITAQNGNVSVLADGTLKVSEAVSAEAAGKNVVLETTAGDVVIGKDAVGNVVATATVKAGQDATVVAAGAIDQNADVTATAGDAWVEAKGGDVTMKDGTTTTAKDNAYVAATGNADATKGDVKLSLVKTTATADGAVSVYSAKGSIKDNTVAETANVQSQKVRLEAGAAIGEVRDVANDENAGDIETTADNIEILAGTDAFVHNTKDVTVGGVNGVTVKKVATATAVAASSANNAGGDLTGAEATAGNLSILTEGSLTVSEKVEAGRTANEKNAVLVANANTALADDDEKAGNVTVNADMKASQHATVVAAGKIDQNATITAMAGDAWVQAQGGDVTMKDAETVKTAAGGNAYVAATGNAGDVKLSLVEVTGIGDGKGYASIYSKNGSILDNLTAGETAVAETVNVTAQKMHLEAGAAVGGKNDADIETTADNIEILAGTDAFVHNTKAVTVGEVGAVTANKVATATAVAAGTAAGGDLTGAKASAGDLSILTDGQMTVAVAEAVSATTAGKNAVLETTAGGIVLNAGVTAGQNATILAKTTIDQKATVTATAGDAWVEAKGGSVTMKANDANVKTIAGGSAYVAATGAKSADPALDKSGDVKLTVVEAANGKVSVFSKDGSISDNLQGGDDVANIVANSVRLQAGTSVGGSNAADIDTTVDNIEVKAGKDDSTDDTDAFVHNTKAVTVGGVNGVEVKKVATATAVASSSANNAGGDLTGAEATAGDLSVLADGTLKISEVVSAEADGKNVVLEAAKDAAGNAGDVVIGKDATGNVVATATVKAGQHATVVATGAIDQNADITAKEGDAWVQAQAGSVTMANGTTTTAGNNARVAASGNVKLLAVNAGNAASIVATAGGIVDNTEAEAANVTAKNLRMEAGAAIGGANDADIETSVDNLEFKAGTDAFVHNTKAVTIGGVGDVKVKKVVTANATTVDLTDADLNNGQTGAKATAGNLSILTEGSLKVSEKAEAGRTADGKNAVLVANANTALANDADKAGNVTVNAEVKASQHTTIVAAGAIDQNADVTAKAGDAWVEAKGGDVTMADGTTTKATAGNARVRASGNVAISSVKAAKGNVSIKSGGSITDSTAAETANVTAKNLRIEAGKSIGGANAGNIDTSVNNIEFKAGTDAFVHNDKALKVGNVNAVTVKKVEAADGAAAAAPADADLNDGKAGAKATVGSIRLVAKGGLTGAEVIDANGDMRLESEAGAVTLNDTVTAGKNLTIASKGKMTAKESITAKKGDLYVNAGGDIDINKDANANDKNGVMALVSGGKIVANSVKAGTFYAKGKNNVEPGKMSVKSAVLSTEGTFKTTLEKDTTLSVSAGKDVIIHANDHSLTVGGSASEDGKALTVTEVKAEGKTAEIELNGTGKGDKSVTGIEARDGDVRIGKAKDGEKDEKKAKEITGTSIVAKNDVLIGTTGDYSVDTTSAGGTADLDIGGNLKFNTLSAGTLVADAGSVAAGKATVGGSATITSHGAITDNGSQINASTLTMMTDGDIGSFSKPINIQAGTIQSISGGDIYLNDTTANNDVTLGSIKASGDLDLTAASIGIGTQGSKGYVDGNGGADNLSSGGNMKLNVAGRMGKASDPLEISVGGKLTLDSGDLHGSNEDNPVAPNLSPISFFYLISTGKAPNMNDSWNQYVGAGKIPGLVIYKGQILAASPDLWLKINRALAFTIDTPELKSKQGVFGTPLFVHTDMDVSEAASIGSVDYVSIADTIMDTLADPDVNDRLIDIVEENDDPDLKRRFDIQRKNPLGRDALYSKEFQGKTQAERDAEAKTKAERAAAAAKAKADARAAKEIKARAEAEAKAKAKAEARAKAKAEAEAKAKAKAAREAEAKAAREAKSKAKVEAKASAKADVAMK